MSTYEVISSACELPACDAQGRAIICGKPATTTRTTFDVTFSACEACAAALDARQGPPKDPPAPLPAEDAPDMKAATDRARARFEARQAKLPPEKRRTWEQACAADHDDLGKALRRGGKRGGP